MADNYYRPGGFGGFSFFPPVIKNLLIFNGVIYLIQILMENVAIGADRADHILLKWFALIPLGYGFEVWQLITYQFMHGSFSHILYNMFALWMFGMEIENEWGSKKFLLYYLLCGVGAGLFHLFLSPLLGTGIAPTIGASGAIFGVMIAFALMYPDRYIFLYFFIPIKAKYLIVFLIALEFLMVDNGGSGVAHLAHLGGAIVGFIYIMFDKSIYISIKSSLRSSGRGSFGGGGGSASGGNTSWTSNFGRKEENKVQDAEFYDIKDDYSNITQADIDKILDKISQSGYQNLTEKEKKILFEASKKLNR
jgi:membrane associated rhomboid family serine protease